VTRRDYYEILGVSRTASDADIKTAYRKLAMKVHPDRNPGDKAAEEKFKEAAEAYAILADAEKRSLYDRFGHAGVKSVPGGAGFDPSVFQEFGDFADILGNMFGFGDLFGGRKRARRAAAAARRRAHRRPRARSATARGRSASSRASSPSRAPARSAAAPAR